NGILQEDNDGSHVTCSDWNIAWKYKDQRGIRRLIHPAQLPDLNPQGGLWNVLKRRIRCRHGD
ncbi:hypothetical protein K469DRAFT_571781, partial [Zopfia rhizophila CBS 207.26]